ncbi:hypothetical protein K8942_00490 [Candidatus Peribacteria bacterium]|nr:MAG: hypothetical protein K8942_00490 [Candidatus Peribacteria bacterium]
MRSAVTDDVAIKMTAKDWKTLEEVLKLEQALLKMRGQKLEKEQKRKAKEDATLFKRLLNDPKAAKTIEHCFGDAAVLKSMRAFHAEVMKKLVA